MVRILLIISLAAASLAAKDRAWQPGTLLDKSLNPYFKIAAAGSSGDASVKYENFAVEVNVHRSSGDVVFDDYVIESANTVYMVEVTRFKNTKEAHLSLSLPLNFAVEKSKFWIKDLDRDEYEAQILKQVEKGAGAAGSTLASVQAPAQAVSANAAPAKAVPANAASAKAEAKQDPFALASLQSPASKTPSPAAPQPAVQAVPKPAPKPEATVSASAAQPPAKPAQKPEPVAKPDSTAAARGSSKDRAWQSGQLLIVVNNRYFLNVTYSSDSDGSSWPFVQGSDGRYTVNGQIGNPTTSLYTYDNYVIESQFCAYLVQRMRPKTSAQARFPGAKALKFAVEKTKLWVVDDENIEYETKIIKLIQKDAIVDPVTRVAAR